MQNRMNISSGAKWESIVGYSRAVKIDDKLFVAGTTAVDENGNVAGSDAYSQTKFILNKITNVLKEAGMSLENVVRTRMFVVNIDRDWEEIGKAHGEFFRDIKPAATMVQVAKLIQPDLLIEIEVDAVK